MRHALLVFCLISISAVIFNTSLFADKKKTTSRTSFLITNDSGEDKNIALNGSGGFFGDIKELVNFINRKYDASVYPYNYQKAWRFMLDYTWSAKLPLTHQEWYHNVLSFINSTGWGFCDDKAIVLAKIWLAMGYKSRVYYLNGHVVPEIYFHKHWEMWDPTFHVFYKDSLNTILGVEDLYKNNSAVLYNHKDIRITQSLWAIRMGFSKKTAQLYQPSDKSNIFYPVVDSVKYNFAQFLIPKGSFIVFPVYQEFPLKSMSYNKIKNQKDYAQLMLYLPPDWTGEIKYPLVFHALTSTDAEVLIDKRKYVLSKNNKNAVNNIFYSQSSIEILHNGNGISLFFLINPRLSNRLDNFENIKQKLMSNSIYIHLIELPFKKRHVIIYPDEIETDKGQSYWKIIKYFFENLVI